MKFEGAIPLPQSQHTVGVVVFGRGHGCYRRFALVQGIYVRLNGFKRIQDVCFFRKHLGGI